MSSFVFALGVLLSLSGAAAVFSGYGVIEVERGWTSVIAGTTAVSAGIMTIGIASILRSIVRLQAFLEAEKGFLPLLSELVLYQSRHNPRHPDQVLRGIDDGPEDSSVAASVGPTQGVGSATWIRPDEATGSDVFAVAAQAFHIYRDPAAGASDPPVAPVSFDAVYEGAAVEIDRRLPVPEPGARQVHDGDETRDHDGFETNRSKVTNVILPESSERDADAEAARSAFSHPAGDDEATPGPGRLEFHAAGAEPEPAPFPVEKAGIEASPVAVAPSEPDASVDLDGVPAAGEPDPDPGRVTARYEADGTSYVMYADGSIDARSERGSFHFQSLTELKAFMEAQG